MYSLVFLQEKTKQQFSANKTIVLRRQNYEKRYNELIYNEL